MIITDNGNYIAIGEYEEVRVYKPRVKYGKMFPASIDWKSSGQQTIEDTETTITYLQKAIEIAQKLDQENK